MSPRLAAFAVLTLALAASAQTATDPSLVFDKLEAMVPMRDGVKLQTHVYVPKQSKEKLPFLLMRTPYGFDADAKGFTRWLVKPWLQDLLRDGYIVVMQSVRGRFKSEGLFELERPPRDRTSSKAIDEGTDTWDTVDWLLAHVPNHNGRVGMLGASVPGRLVTMAMYEPHPAIKAFSPQAAPGDNFKGDDDYHGGALRAGVMAPFFFDMETSKEFGEFPVDRLDLYDFFLSLGSLAHLEERYFKGSVKSWKDFVAHPTYDAYWKSRAVASTLKSAPAPTLHVGGEYDQEDRRGPMATFQALEANDTKGFNHLVLGPWAHRTWRNDDGDHLGRLAFGSATAKFFRAEVQAPFFACALKDACTTTLPKALVFQTGSNVWQRLDAWPPKGTTEKSLYLRAGGLLSFEAPTAEGGGEADAWVSDPARPVPSQPRPVATPNLAPDAARDAWAESLATDQRFSDGRPDVRTWSTPPLAGDVTVAGEVTARLFFATTGADADLVVKLIDVEPELNKADPLLGGFEHLVCGEILRGRFRESFETPKPFTPGKAEAVNVDLLPRSHVFKKGHRIMVQVQSSWFPLYDRNPQTWVPNLLLAKDSDFVAQTHTVFRSKSRPSRVTFASP